MPLRCLSTLLRDAPETLAGKKVLLRVDYNVPIAHGRITDKARILRTIPTLRALLDAGAVVVVLSHFGRPKKGFDRRFSLAPVVDALAETLREQLGHSVPVHFGVESVGQEAHHAIAATAPSEVVLLENLRFYAEESTNDDTFSAQLATLGDIFINDAFSCVHREHASIVGITRHIPSYAGLLLEEELRTLEQALEAPERPVVAVVGGAKISTKIKMLKNLLDKVDQLLIGGAMANTFLYAEGKEIGHSLFEKDQVALAQAILAKAHASDCHVSLPTDAVTAQELTPHTNCSVFSCDNVPSDQAILDIGPETTQHWQDIISTCRTLVWNGPLGACEVPPFDVGTTTIARTVALQTKKGACFSVAGGGDILASLKQAGLQEQFSYVSTAGGAFLQWLEGTTLPGVQALES